jgi:superfamily I DNA and/or RNA helicase
MASVAKCFKQVVIMIDEASLTTDLAVCNALVNTVKFHRLQSEFGGKSPIAKLVMIGDKAQGYPLVRSENEAFNIFGQQISRALYERLVLAGADVRAMWVQYRSVPALCELPNQRWYGGKLQCSEERQQARLLPQLREMLVQLFDVDLNKADIAKCEDVDKAEDAYLRLLLADVPGGECQIEPQTQSRLNMANVEVIIRIFKKLVSRPAFSR